MKKIIIVLGLVILGTQAPAQSVTCQIQENFSNQSFNQNLEWDLGAVSTKVFSSHVASQGSLIAENDFITLNLNGGLLKKPIVAKLGAQPGSSLRLQVVPSERESNYIMIDCQVDGSVTFEKVLGGQCEMTEAAGAQKLTTSFDIPVAQGGHDIFVLPSAQIAPLEGWVMLYNGVLVTSLQNKNTMVGLTTIGSWSQTSTVQWFPSLQNIKVTVKCSPVRPN